MLRLDCIDSVFCDALLTDPNGQLLFMSVWGRDTTISELLARMTLPDHEDGITSFTAHGEGHKLSVTVPNARLLDKQQGRAPGSLFGDLVQLFVYADKLRRPDHANREAWAVFRLAGDHDQEPDVWPLIVETCHVPLAPYWRGPIVHAFREREWISRITGYQVGAIGVHLGSDELETCIEDLVTQGVLTLKR